MNDLRTAAQQALEALEWISDCHVGDDDDAGECASCHQRSYKPHAPDCKKNNAIAALRAALAQQAEPVQEPAYKVKVAGRWHDTEPLAPAFSLPDGEHLLYTAPPQRKPLTEEEIRAVYGDDLKYRDGDYLRFARAVEQASWEKNHG